MRPRFVEKYGTNMNLWQDNSPQDFWQCADSVTEDQWRRATEAAMPFLGIRPQPEGVHRLLECTLGEGQFGAHRWRLGTATRIYYMLKPILPRFITRIARQIHSGHARQDALLSWPIEERYVRFVRATLENLLELSGLETMKIRPLWPEGCRYSLILTHDIESAEGLAYVPKVAELEERLGFRSSFNLVPESYLIDQRLIKDLKDRGFEIGVHGLKHDGKLYWSEKTFRDRALRINDHLRDLGAVGFRSPLTHRNPFWMQALEIEYDLSFFDTDPFEPVPGGCMSIWPFSVGRFTELPYTLVQDYTLTRVLGERSPESWLQKVEFVAENWGMALLNTHPDYLLSPEVWHVYQTFLRAMAEREDYWNPLPREAARWWRSRESEQSAGEDSSPYRQYWHASLDAGRLNIEIRSRP